MILNNYSIKILKTIHINNFENDPTGEFIGIEVQFCIFTPIEQYGLTSESYINKLYTDKEVIDNITISNTTSIEELLQVISKNVNEDENIQNIIIANINKDIDLFLNPPPIVEESIG